MTGGAEANVQHFIGGTIQQNSPNLQFNILAESQKNLFVNYFIFHTRHHLENVSLYCSDAPNICDIVTLILTF